MRPLASLPGGSPQSVRCFYGGPPELIPLAGYERQVEGDTVDEALVPFLEGGPDLVRRGLDDEGVEHLVGDQARHLVPPLVPRELPELIPDLSPTVYVQDGAIGGCRGIESGLNAHLLSLVFDL